MKKLRGFTLIEMIIVLVIVSIIAAYTSKMLNQGFNAYLTGKSVEEAAWQARLALARLALDLRTIRSPSDITTATSSQLVFTDINSNSVTYDVSSSTLQRNGITLANGITNFTLSYFDKNGATTAATQNIRYINFSFTVTLNNVNLSYASGIYLRDLT